MKNLFYLFIIFIVIYLAIAFWSCGPKVVKNPKIDSNDYGCKPPPPSEFTAAGIDLKFAQSTFGKVVTGEINIKTDPKVITLLSSAAVHDQIRSYLRCLALKRDGYTHEQAAYFDMMSAFLQTQPSGEQFQLWQERNPFPQK